MNTVLCLAHFCEVHGPQTLLVTQIARPDLPIASETGTSCANCSYNVPQTATIPVLRSRVGPRTIVSSRITSDALLRDACVRALSVETLPKGESSGSFTLSTDNQLLDNTEARNVNVVHVFRITDPRARGQRRAYALIAIGDQSCFRAQHLIKQTFRTWARSIGHLSERHLRTLIRPDFRSSESLDFQHGNDGSLSTSFSSQATPSPPLSLETPPSLDMASQLLFPASMTRQGSASSPVNTSHVSAALPGTPRHMTPVSSFLSAKTVDPDGYPRSSFASSANVSHIPRARSLAEIVGDEHFFVRLHAELCALLERIIEHEAGGKNDETTADEDGIDEGRASDSDDESRSRDQGSVEESDDESHASFGLLGNWRSNANYSSSL